MTKLDLDLVRIAVSCHEKLQGHKEEYEYLLKRQQEAERATNFQHQLWMDAEDRYRKACAEAGIELVEMP